jgi:transcriptional regulator with XRE-family HTH domain
MFATNNVAMVITEQRRNFGQYIKLKREERGFSQEGAANKAEMDRQQWYRIENGKSGTKRETVIKMAKAIDADVDEALTLAGYAPTTGPNEVTVIANRLANGVMASGFNDLEDEDLREAFLEDMQTIAQSMVQRRLQEQQKRKSQNKQ